jgi:methyl-accepting chemotaxis protein
MNSLSIKKRLVVLTALALLALLVVGYVGTRGIERGSEAVREKSGRNSVQEKNAYDRLDRGRKLYESIQQQAEEAALWNDIKGKWADWRKSNETFDAMAADLDNAATPDQRRVLFEKLDAHFAEAAPLSKAIDASLEQLISINNSIGKTAYLASAETMESATRIIYITIGLSALIVLILATAIVRSITRPLESMNQTIVQIEANSDFTRRVVVDGNDEIGNTARAFNSLVARVQISMKDVLDSVTQVSSAAQTLSQKAGDVSREGGEIIVRAANEMNAISGLVQEASSTMNTLGEQSQQISAIAQVIKDVAEQTNLLALNAAIEAARAGDQGRGFAVVADEVRKLSERTSQSTEEITSMIDKVQKCTKEAVNRMSSVVSRVASGQELASQAGERIRQIQLSAEQVSSAVDEMSPSLREQSVASQEIVKHVESVAQMTDENSAAANATSGSAHQLENLAGWMRKIVSQFKVVVTET